AIHCSPPFFFFQCYRHPRDLRSFPTRRSSDLKDTQLLIRIAQGREESANALEGSWSALEVQEMVAVLQRLLKVQQTLGKVNAARSEEHTSELQSRENLVCRLLLEKKKQSQT